MRKLLLGVAMASLLSRVAYADNEVFFTVNKTRTVEITKNVAKAKDVLITVDFDADATGAALTDANVNARIENNSSGAASGAGENVTADTGDFGIDRLSDITDSLSDNTGIGQFNQDSGNFSNQGNVGAFAATFGEASETTPLTEVTNAQAYVDQRTLDNTSELGGDLTQLVDFVTTGETDPMTLDRDIEARMSGSLIGNEGVFQVNQNAGTGNNQHNVLSAALGANSIEALADSGLSQITSGNEITDVNTVKLSLITGSALGNSGVVTFNQATGTFNSQATIINISAITSAVGL